MSGLFFLHRYHKSYGEIINSLNGLACHYGDILSRHNVVVFGDLFLILMIERNYLLIFNLY